MILFLVVLAFIRKGSAGDNETIEAISQVVAGFGYQLRNKRPVCDGSLRALGFDCESGTPIRIDGLSISSRVDTTIFSKKAYISPAIGKLTNLKNFTAVGVQRSTIPKELLELKSLKNLHLKNTWLYAPLPAVGDRSDLNCTIETVSITELQCTSCYPRGPCKIVIPESERGSLTDRYCNPGCYLLEPGETIVDLFFDERQFVTYPEKKRIWLEKYYPIVQKRATAAGDPHMGNLDLYQGSPSTSKILASLSAAATDAPRADQRTGSSQNESATDDSCGLLLAGTLLCVSLLAIL